MKAPVRFRGDIVLLPEAAEPNGSSRRRVGALLERQMAGWREVSRRPEQAVWSGIKKKLKRGGVLGGRFSGRRGVTRCKSER